jgi:DNA adenine methylase
MLQSPLRYPGGKAKLFERVAGIIARNKLFGSVYAEPFAGGAGLALKLLAGGFVESIHLNDNDPAIHAFWRAVLQSPDEFCERIRSVPLTLDEWARQKAVHSDRRARVFDLGFATFYLNRTNRSGIVSGAGPIGGIGQAGTWRIDARFNRDALSDIVMLLSKYRRQISVSCRDAMDFMNQNIQKPNWITYLDPPYYVNGHRLYRNFYVHNDHVQIARFLAKNRRRSWFVSYDDVPTIRELYSGFSVESYDLQYSAAATRSGREVMFLSDKLA